MTSSTTMSMTDMASMTTSSVMATTSAAMSGHDMSSMEGMGGSCKISMLWNWYTIDACFITPSWRITSHGMFAASCIGVMLLVVMLEFLRRLSNEYDKFILRKFQQTVAAQTEQVRRLNPGDATFSGPQTVTFRASPVQQLVRSVLHAMTFGLAYIIMLLAMYYNGYLIISIFIGAGLGKFLCDWMVVKIPMGGSAGPGKSRTACDEPTVCCG